MLLDAPGEWFYNETEMKLYLYPNGTFPTNGIGTVHKRLFNVQGSMDSTTCGTLSSKIMHSFSVATVQLLRLAQQKLIDGTNGNQPRGNVIANNVMRETTSAYIQALTAQTTFSKNVFFNGPRAGMNFNDGFGGGHNVARVSTWFVRLAIMDHLTRGTDNHISRR